MNDRELAERIIDRLKAAMGSRLIVDQSDRDFVTDMAEALRESLPDEVRAAPNWHMAAHRWGADNQLCLLASALWWSGDGSRSEVLAVFLDDKGVPQRHVLELEHGSGGRKQVTAVKPCPPDTCMCPMRKIEVSGDNLRAFCCPKHGPKLDLWAIHEEGVEEGRAINHDELAELDLLRQEPRLTPTERDYLATVVKSLNPREDLMGAMMSRTWHQDLGEGGVARLAAKLEGNDDGMVEEAERFSWTSRTMTLDRNNGQAICRLPAALFDKLVAFGIERGFGSRELKVIESPTVDMASLKAAVDLGIELPVGWRVDESLSPNLRFYVGDVMVGVWSPSGTMVIYPPSGRVEVKGITGAGDAVQEAVRQAHLNGCSGFRPKTTSGITIVAQKNPGVPIPPEGVFHLFRDHDTKLKVKDADGTVRDATEAEIALGEQLAGGRFRP